MEKRLRLSDDDRMLLLLALADYAESHAEYHGLDGKVWLLAERLMGASPGPVPQNVSLWIREETGTLNGPMDTYLPNGQVSNEELSAGDQPAENAERRAETPTTTDPQSSPPVTGTISHTNGTEGFEPRPAAEQRRFSHVERVFAWQQLRHQQTAEAEKKKLWKTTRCAADPRCKKRIVVLDSSGWVCEEHRSDRRYHEPPDGWSPLAQ